MTIVSGYFHKNIIFFKHTFEKRFFKHQVVNIKPPRKARMIVTKAHIATFLQRQELLNFLLDTAGDVLVNVYQADHARTPEGEGKELNGSRDREARVRVLVVRLQVVHSAQLLSCLSLGWLTPGPDGWPQPRLGSLLLTWSLAGVMLSSGGRGLAAD